MEEPQATERTKRMIIALAALLTVAFTVLQFAVNVVAVLVLDVVQFFRGRP